MCKLYAGSLGTLAVISELTFRVQPSPEATAAVHLAFPSLPAALEAVHTLLQADLEPEALEAMNGNAFEAVSSDAPAAAWT